MRASRLLSRVDAFWARRESADALAAVRIGVALVVLWDMAEIARLDLVEALWAPIEDGGIGPASLERPLSLLYEVLGASAGTAWLLFGAVCVLAAAVLVGFWTRTSSALLVLALAEIARLSPESDRGIDTLLRDVLVVLACSGAGATLSLDAWLRHRAWAREVEVPAWPRYVLVAQVVILYFAAGMLKQSAAWTSLDDYSALYVILSQPHYASVPLSPELAQTIHPLLLAGTIVTLAFERSSLLLPFLLYAREAAGPAGRLRMLVNRGRLLELWIATGVVFHLGLAATMELGTFPWGCLALYPVLLPPGVPRRWLSQRR